MSTSRKPGVRDKAESLFAGGFRNEEERLQVLARAAAVNPEKEQRPVLKLHQKDY